MLRNSCPYTTSPIFSSLLTTRCIFPSMNSSPLQTVSGTYPHSSQTPRSLRQNPVPIIDASSCFTFLDLDLLRSSTSPSAHWSPFRISYAFLFSLCSCAAFAAQHRLSSHSSFQYRTTLCFLFSLAQRCGSLP